MKRKPKPEKKKLPMKTRLIIIGIMFVIVNLIFFLVFDSSEDSKTQEEIQNENQNKLEETTPEQEFAKFNPPTP